MSVILEETNLKRSDNKQFTRVLLIFLTVGLLFIFYALFSTYYIDPINRCFITIEEDIAGGNKNAIEKSLDYIRKTDNESFKKVCKNVDTIIEKYCFYMDPRVRTEEKFVEQGCYVKGSKAIYILPDKNSSHESIENRANNILKYSKFSEGYWKYN